MGMPGPFDIGIDFAILYKSGEVAAGCAAALVVAIAEGNQ